MQNKKFQNSRIKKWIKNSKHANLMPVAFLLLLERPALKRNIVQYRNWENKFHFPNILINGEPQECQTQYIIDKSNYNTIRMLHFSLKICPIYDFFYWIALSWESSHNLGLPNRIQTTQYWRLVSLWNKKTHSANWSVITARPIYDFE